MAKQDDSVNRIPDSSIADIMPTMPGGSMSPSTVPVDRLAGGEVDEMEACAGGAGEGLEAATFGALLLFQMRLNIHARLGASKNNKIRHRHRMTG
ncbi:hypothetical protein [Bradyrhizobium sp. 930_D9_N1_4]|uniref:hypothetical protein n=1 Tax=Bradyrhizobium sp. 930_D9_N1_4 TaxID=3240374 RepID=UPI003F8B8525